MKSGCAWLVLVAWSAVAHAQTPAASEHAVTASTATTPLATPRHKSPTGAWVLSFGTTFVASYGLVFAGAALTDDGNRNNRALEHGVGVATMVGGVGAFLVGPTVGHIYVDHAWNGWLGLRLAGFGFGLLCGGIAAVVADHDRQDAFVLVFPAALGGAAVVVGIVGEIASAPAAARDYNRHHTLDISVAITPIRVQAGEVPGVGVVGRF